MKISETAGRVFTAVWLLAVAGVLTYGVLNPEFFTEESMIGLMESWGTLAFGGFVVVSLVRGFFLVPSTPIVIAGAMLFPAWLPAVFLISIAGIIVSAAALYHMPGLGGYDALLEQKHPEKIAKLKTHLSRPSAFWIVVGWSAFPLVPTDVICYAAGLVQMSFRRMMFAMLLGEVPLVVGYLILSQRVQGMLG